MAIEEVTSGVEDDSIDRAFGSGSIHCKINFHEVDNLVGRILTLIDASVSDHEQRKAQKRVFKKEIHAWYYDIERAQHPEFRKLMEYGEVHLKD